MAHSTTTEAYPRHDLYTPPAGNPRARGGNRIPVKIQPGHAYIVSKGEYSIGVKYEKTN